MGIGASARQAVAPAIFLGQLPDAREIRCAVLQLGIVGTEVGAAGRTFHRSRCPPPMAGIEKYSGRVNSCPMSSEPMTTPPRVSKLPLAWRGNSGRPIAANSKGKTQPVSSVNTSTLKIAGRICSPSLAGEAGGEAPWAVLSACSSQSLIKGTDWDPLGGDYRKRAKESIEKP